MDQVLMNVVKHICSMERHYWNWQGNVTHNFPMKHKIFAGSYFCNFCCLICDLQKRSLENLNLACGFWVVHGSNPSHSFENISCVLARDCHFSFYFPFNLIFLFFLSPVCKLPGVLVIFIVIDLYICILIFSQCL